MEEKDILIKIGERIRDIRLSKEMTQDNIAEKCNWDYQYVSRIESGKTNMTIKTIIKLCSALEIKLEDIFMDIK